MEKADKKTMSAAAGASSNTGDKVTLALIGQKLDILSSTYDRGHKELVDNNESDHKDLMDKIDKFAMDIKSIERVQAEHGVKIDNIVKDISENVKPDITRAQAGVDDVRTKYNWWSGINTVLATIAGLLGLKS